MVTIAIYLPLVERRHRNPDNHRHDPASGVRPGQGQEFGPNVLVPGPLRSEPRPHGSAPRHSGRLMAQLLTPTPVTPPTTPRGRDAAVMRWLPVAAIGLAPVALAAVLLRPLTDPDTFWHLHTGQFLRDTWQFSGPDPWSQFSSRPFVLHEWLPELGYAAVVQVGGQGALAWLEAICAAALLVAVYACCRQVASALPSACVAALAWLGATGSLAARPQMVTYVLLCVTTTTWLRTARDGRPRWWLVPLAWVWACSHGLWVAGPMVGGAVVVGMLLDRQVPARQVARLALVPVLSVVAAALTPIGPRLLLLPLQVSGYARYVDEWRPPSLTDPFFLATLALAGGCLLAWFRSRTRVPFVHLAVLCVALLWALLYARTVALAAMMLAPLAALTLDLLLPADARRAKVPVRLERTALLTGLAVAAVVTALLVPAKAQGVGPLEPGGLDTQLRALPAGTVVYNQYVTGGWLMLTYPDLHPVVDERTEVYSLPYLDAYFGAIQAMPGWQDTVRRSEASAAVLPVHSPLASALTSQWKWRAVGQDHGYVLLVAT
jgi:hypothetical protein